MLDTSGEFWKGTHPSDINEYLRAYTEEDNIDIKPIICPNCKSEIFRLNIDETDETIQVQCSNCDYEKVILDCVDIWDESEPEIQTCSVCNESTNFNIRVGFIRKENGNVHWVYTGERCANCGSLGSFLNWKINFEPTIDMEKNI